MTASGHPIYGPFDPGKSPFRAKGTTYKGLVTRFDRDLPGGFRSVLERIEDPRSLEFLSQTFLPSSMYDILPLLEAGMVGARIAGKAYRTFVREGAAYQADRDMSGVYRVLLRLASPKLVIDRIPRIFMQYLDFGHVDGNVTGPNRYECTVSGIPSPVCPWIQSVLEGFTPVVLSRSGATEISVIVRSFEVERTESGMALMSGHMSVTWT